MGKEKGEKSTSGTSGRRPGRAGEKAAKEGRCRLAPSLLFFQRMLLGKATDSRKKV